MPETRSLPCPLSDAEVAERALNLAKLVDRLEHNEAEKKAAAEKFKEEAVSLSHDVKLLARQVRERSEERHIEIEYRSDETRFVVETIRCDTGEIIGARPMTEDERREVVQGRLPGIGRRKGN